jgi:thioesterase domain-containing protein
VRPIELEHYLHEHIPLSKAMALTVLSVEEDAVVLRAPLAPNINHSETVFGGSAAALATLAAWALPFARLRAAALPDSLVIQRNTMEYLRPISGDFTARSHLDTPQSWQRFSAALTRKGLGRIAVSAVLEYGGETAGRFSGEFVAFGPSRPQR